MDKENRRRNAEARRALRAAREAEEKQDKALVVDALRAVLKDPETTAAQRLYAVAVLDKVKGYGFVPHDMRNDSALVADFARLVEEAQKKGTK